MSAVDELTTHQQHNGLGIITAVKGRGWGRKAAVIAVETALTESGMRMIASANVPESQNFPHVRWEGSEDGLGHDHASCGMFQQQTGTKWALPGTTTMTTPNGWGPPSVLMDPEKSTALFLNALAQVDWPDMDNWVAAQAVQHSGFSDGSNYRNQDQRAHAIVKALWAKAPAHPSSPGSRTVAGTTGSSDDAATLTAAELDARMEQIVKNALRAYHRGGDFGRWSTTRFPAFLHPAGHGIGPRLSIVERRLKRLEKSLKHLETKGP